MIMLPAQRVHGPWNKEEPRVSILAEWEDENVPDTLFTVGVTEGDVPQQVADFISSVRVHSQVNNLGPVTFSRGRLTLA